MKGLLYKEWATLTSSYKQSVFFIAFLYGGISILTGQTGMAYALLVVFSILITSTISFDENSHCQGPQLVVSDHRCTRRLYWAGRFRLARFDAAVQCLRRSVADGAGCSVCGAAGGVFCEL